MKKVYKAPSICVEDARLSAFCSGGCTDTQAHIDEMQPFIDLNYNFGDGQCYCYHGTGMGDLPALIPVNS